jgi:phosphoribosylaminoimidazolecarboxamide formyltransferase/IMP cyclohydrolase
MPTALLSVFSKEGIGAFGKALSDLGWDLLSSGGTARALLEKNVPVRDIVEIVGPPILGHRVATLSRELHAALLARDTPEDMEELAKLGVPRIDLVCVDMYPLERAIIENGTLSAVIEKTDIGGPCLLRSAAKGRRIVICDASDRGLVIQWLRSGRPEKEMVIAKLAAKAEFVVARYCLLSASYLSKEYYGWELGQNGLVVVGGHINMPSTAMIQ